MSSPTRHVVVGAKAWQASTESLQRGIAHAEYYSTLPGIRKAFVVLPSGKTNPGAGVVTLDQLIPSFEGGSAMMLHVTSLPNTRYHTFHRMA